IVALEAQRGIEPPEAHVEGRGAGRRPTHDEIIDLDLGGRGAAVARRDVGRQLAEQVEIVRPGPEQADGELRGQCGIARLLAIPDERSDREPGDGYRFGRFERDLTLLRAGRTSGQAQKRTAQGGAHASPPEWCETSPRPSASP